MQLEYAKNPVWANAEHTLIDLTIKWDAIAEELPFTASPTDTEAHGRAIFAAAAAGDFGPVAEYVPPPDPEPPLPPTPEQISTLRRQAYQLEADPIFFKWQRQEATEQEWLDKIAEIRARYPEA
jgi:hypothetical protein